MLLFFTRRQTARKTLNGRAPLAHECSFGRMPRGQVHDQHVIVTVPALDPFQELTQVAGEAGGARSARLRRQGGQRGGRRLRGAASRAAALRR